MSASIAVNGVAGSDDDVPINVAVTLADVGVGATTYAWSILDQPPGAADALSDDDVDEVTFTPRKEGTYLVQLVTDAGQFGESTATAIVGVRQVKTRTRVPAAGEASEVGSGGWSAAANELLRLVDQLRADPGLVVAQNAEAGAVAAGKVVKLTTSVALKSGLPGAERALAFALATPANLSGTTPMLGVVVGAVAGGGVASGALAFVRLLGIYPALVGGSPAAGTLIYVNASSDASATPGTPAWPIGRALGTSGDTVLTPWPTHSNQLDVTALLLRSGALAMTGALDCGGFNLTNIGRVAEAPTTFAWSAGAASVDVSAKNDFCASNTLTQNSTLTLTNGVDGCQGTIYVKQDGTGSWTLSFTVSGRTILREELATDSNPQAAANTYTGYCYDYKTVGGTAVCIISRFKLT